MTQQQFPEFEFIPRKDAPPPAHLSRDWYRQKVRAVFATPDQVLCVRIGVRLPAKLQSQFKRAAHAEGIGPMIETWREGECIYVAARVADKESDESTRRINRKGQ